MKRTLAKFSANSWHIRHQLLQTMYMYVCSDEGFMLFDKGYIYMCSMVHVHVVDMLESPLVNSILLSRL